MAGFREHLPSWTSLVEELAGEAHPLRRHKLIQAAQGLWEPDTVQRLYDESIRLMQVELRPGGAIGAVRVVALPQTGGRRAGPGVPRHGPHPVPQGQVRRGQQRVSEGAGHLRAPGKRAGDRTHAERLAAEPDLPGPLRRGHGCRPAGLPDLLRSTATGCASARLDANMGNLVYRQDRFEEALELYQRACDEFSEIGEPQDVAIALKNIATCQISMNDFRRALTTYHRARNYALEHDMPLLAAGGGLQHRVPVLPPRRIHARHRAVPRRARALPRARRHLPRSALRSRPVGDVPRAEPQRGGRAPGAARAGGIPAAGHAATRPPRR